MPAPSPEPLWSFPRPEGGQSVWHNLPTSSARDGRQEDMPARLLSGDGVGLLLGPYHVLARLGAGAMGQVYKAEHLLLKRLVALKVLRASPATESRATLPPGMRLDAGSQHPFHHEARAAARLNHPNVVLLYDAAELVGLQVLVLEFVDGPDLARLVTETGPLPVALACECVRQVALGLQYAHDRGLVHGDVKPCNLLVQNAWTAPSVKLLDLGLARPHGEQLPPVGPIVPAAGLAGTPDFMAPEVARGDGPAEPRSDQYSLGCTFYYLLTGKPPFPGGTWLEKLLRHQLDTPAPVQELRPEVPAEVAAVLSRLLAREPEGRYPNAAAVAGNLQEWLFRQRDRGVAEAARVTPLGVEFPTFADLGAAPAEARLPARPSNPSGPDKPRRRSLGWSLLGGALVGLLAAWIAGQWLERLGLLPIEDDAVPSAAVGRPFSSARDGTEFETLAEAVAGAQDGDTLLVRGPGPYATAPVAVRGKALTLRAAPGSRPCLELWAGNQKHFWQALVETDSALTVEGLELRRAGIERGNESGLAPLVVSTGPALHLHDCRMIAPGGTMLVLCRGCQAVEIRGCSFQAEALAVCAEAPELSPIELIVQANEWKVVNAGGTALALCASEGRASAGRLVLEDNQIEAGRALTLTSWTGRLDVQARGNTFQWREALVSFAACTTAEDWRQNLTWRGQQNRYLPGSAWVLVEGVPAEPHNLAGWHALWAEEEPGGSGSNQE